MSSLFPKLLLVNKLFLTYFMFQFFSLLLAFISVQNLKVSAVLIFLPLTFLLSKENENYINFLSAVFRPFSSIIVSLQPLLLFKVTLDDFFLYSCLITSIILSLQKYNEKYYMFAVMSPFR